MGSREQNEKKFGKWKTLSHSGRLYYLDVPGHHGWTARYLKEVDEEENTLRFFQEIRNEKGELVEVHEKYPEDKGHRRIEGTS